jgi:uncharacterized protein Yka (UPF0111/DUF47 family)
MAEGAIFPGHSQESRPHGRRLAQLRPSNTAATNDPCHHYRAEPDIYHPFDREDIHRLTSSLDDVLDYVNAAGMRLRLYRINEPPPVASELAGLIVRQSEELAQGVSLLEQNQRVLEHCVEVHRLENEADRVSRNAIAELFDNEKDPIRLIKMKELYEVLETATDKAEDAAMCWKQWP